MPCPLKSCRFPSVDGLCLGFSLIDQRSFTFTLFLFAGRLIFYTFVGVFNQSNTYEKNIITIVCCCFGDRNLFLSEGCAGRFRPVGHQKAHLPAMFPCWWMKNSLPFPKRLWHEASPKRKVYAVNVYEKKRRCEVVCQVCLWPLHRPLRRWISCWPKAISTVSSAWLSPTTRMPCIIRMANTLHLFCTGAPMRQQRQRTSLSSQRQPISHTSRRAIRTSLIRKSSCTQGAYKHYGVVEDFDPSTGTKRDNSGSQGCFRTAFGCHSAIRG